MKWFLLVILTFIVLFICISFYDMHKIKIVRYQLKSNKLARTSKLVFLSDLHNHLFGKKNYRLLKKIYLLDPDYIIIGGDILTAIPNKKNRVASDLIIQLTKKYHVYYGLGNHEYRAKIYTETYGNMYNEYVEMIKNPKLHILNNQSIVLKNENIVISGLSIDRRYYNRKKKLQKDIKNMELEKKLGKANSLKYQILLAHNPDYFSEYDKWRPDLTLSGHFHGGIIRIPGIGGLLSASLQVFPHYDGGIYKGKNGSLIISRGLGMHTIPIRIFNPCELVCIDLMKE